jgi:DNA-binding NarL/FixJ family response regulator
MSDTADLRVVVVDDHALIRQGVRALLGSVPGMELVGEAADGEEAQERVRELRPDVVLMDLHMPGTDGIAATRAIVADDDNRSAVLVVSMLDDDASVFAAMQAGARGYVLKGADPDELCGAIRGVARGEAIFGPGVANRVLDLFSTPLPATARPFPELTGRELEVLDLVARGWTNPNIGRTLHLSPRTVANHVSNILAKLHATDRTDAALRARRVGLGDDGA